MKLNQIILSLIIIIILIIWCFNNKESFYDATTATTATTATKLNAKSGTSDDITIVSEYITKAELKDFNTFIDKDYNFKNYTNSPSMKIVFFDFIKDTDAKNNSNLILTKKETNTPTTIGFYLHIKTEDNTFYSDEKTIITIQNDGVVGDSIKLNATYNSIQSNYTITIKYNNDDLEIKDIVLNNKDHITWFVLEFDNENNTISVNINNKYFKIIETENKLNIKTITFGGSDGIKAMLGKILVFSKLLNEEICNYYYCYDKNICNFDLNDKDKDNKKLYGSKNANKCIEECINNVSCNITNCQQICLECQNIEGREWSESEKINICPWYESIKVLNIDVPNPPIIRGFGGDAEEEGYINVEWKKPYDNNSPINKYILEIVETLSNNNSSIFITIPNNNCDICEYRVNNLKLQTEYDLHLRAVNNRGIGRKSKKITIKTKGNNGDLLKNIYSDISGDFEQTKNYQCDDSYSNSDHILDYIKNNDIDIQTYVNANI